MLQLKALSDLKGYDIRATFPAKEQGKHDRQPTTWLFIGCNWTPREALTLV
jgi:hypothetical protein